MLAAALFACLGPLQAQPVSATKVERQGDAIVFRGRIDDAAATTFLQLLQDEAKGALRGPFNLEARRAAGFGEGEMRGQRIG